MNYKGKKYSIEGFVKLLIVLSLMLAYGCEEKEDDYWKIMKLESEVFDLKNENERLKNISDINKGVSDYLMRLRKEEVVDHISTIVRLNKNNIAEKYRGRLAKSISSDEIRKARKIVNEFIERPDNVDTEENQEFVTYVVRNIYPLDSKEKIDLLVEACPSYSPTDYSYFRLHCDRLLGYGKIFFQSVTEEKLSSKDSPLYDLIDGI